MSPEFLDGFQYGMVGVIVLYFVMRLLDYAFASPLNKRINQKKSQLPPEEG